MGARVGVRAEAGCGFAALERSIEVQLDAYPASRYLLPQNFLNFP